MTRRRLGVSRIGFKAGAMRRTKPRFRKHRSKFRPGYDRTAGYYGRFSKPGELKFFDLDIDDAVVAANGTIAQDSVNKIAQGVTEVTRVGRKCTIRAINWRWQIDLPILATANSSIGDVVRVILYLDKQANGATAAVTDILESDDYQSFNNLANKSRFRTLMDREYTLTAPSAAGDGAANDMSADRITDSFYKKCNIPIEFDATTGAITEIKSNNIGVLLLGLNGLAGFDSKMRLRFSDQ